MIIPDQHMHTIFSPDADELATFDNYLVKARDAQVSSLTFTDHVDLDTTMELFQKIPDYYRVKTLLNQLQKTTDIDLLMGVEIGYQPHLHDAYDNLLKTHDFDFVIMSIHEGDQRDFYSGAFFTGKTQASAYKRYFEIVKEAVKQYDNYDIFGHIDYIIRYGGYQEKAYDFKTYQPIIDEILKIIIRNNKGIELNTSGLRYGLEVTHPRYELIKRYKELGGTIITIGSDAHHPKDFQADFDIAVKLLKKAGFNAITRFKKRVPESIPLK